MYAMHPRATDSGKSHDVATFAGAVGGSIGFLAVLAISLFISIYRRRTLAARRDRRARSGQHRSADGNYDTESFHTDASEDGPPMQGPAPFVPRYFPGTVIPSAPPPYVAGGSPTEATDSLLRSTSPVMSPASPSPWQTHLYLQAEDRAAYADRPPPTPPPIALEDGGYFPPPPPFRVAIASPIPAILANLASSPLTALSSSSPTSSSDTEGAAETNSYPYISSSSPSLSGRARRHSDAHSNRSRTSDRPPSFVSTASDRGALNPQTPLPSSSSEAHEEAAVLHQEGPERET